MSFGENSRWTDDMVQRLRNDWADGLPTSEIGRRLGVTKSAIVGKAHRLDLPGRPPPIGSTETKISYEKVAAILAGVKSGKSDHFIARELGIGRETATRIRMKNGGIRRALCPVSTLPPLQSVSAWNANEPPSPEKRELVVRLLIAGRANAATAAESGVKLAEVRKIRLTIEVPKKIKAPRDRKIEARERGPKVFAGNDLNRFNMRSHVDQWTPTVGMHFKFGSRKPVGTFPTSDEISAHIATRGVTLCPTAAVGVTTGAISDVDSAAIAAHDTAVYDAWHTKNYDRSMRGTIAASRAAAMRR